MPPQKAAYLEPPQHCMIETLPAELLHHIFTFLKNKEIIAARATCSLLCAIGAEHVLDEIGLVFQRDKFEGLVELAKRTLFSERVKSL